MAKHPHIHLTARADTGAHRKGEHVEDEAEVNRILSGEHRHHYVRVTADNGAAPEEIEDKVAPPALPAPSTHD